MPKDMEAQVASGIYGFVFARGGSKGVPGKNIRPLAGKPLIAYSIETGLKSSYIGRIIVSTNDTKIADTARRYGAEVPFERPAGLARDDSPEWLAWRHALGAVACDPEAPPIEIFVSLPPTSPLRHVKDVDRCIETLMNTDADIVITVKQAGRHPSFNMVTINSVGEAGLVMPLEKTILRRQDAPQVYDMTTVAYVTRPDYIMRTGSIFEGKVRAVEIPEERALDIDTELDFSFGEFLIERRK